MSSTFSSTMINSFPSYLAEPYQQNETQSTTVSGRSNNSNARFDPYSSDHSFSLNDFFPDLAPSTSQSSTVSTTHSNTVPIEQNSLIPAEKTKKGKVSNKELIRPLEDYGIFDPSRELPDLPNLNTLRDNNKKVFWFFILKLLMDSTNKKSIAWTGRGREFVIRSVSDVATIWSREQGLTHVVRLDSVRRNLRACYKKRIMIPVDAQSNQYAFHTEPSKYIGMTREQLTNFIDVHNINSLHPHPSESVSPPLATLSTPSTINPQMLPPINDVIPYPTPSNSIDISIPLVHDPYSTPTSPSTSDISLPVASLPTPGPSVTPTQFPGYPHYPPIYDSNQFMDPYWSAPAPVTYPDPTQYPTPYYPIDNVNYHHNYLMY